MQFWPFRGRAPGRSGPAPNGNQVEETAPGGLNIVVSEGTKTFIRFYCGGMAGPAHGSFLTAEQALRSATLVDAPFAGRKVEQILAQAPEDHCVYGFQLMHRVKSGPLHWLFRKAAETIQPITEPTWVGKIEESPEGLPVLTTKLGDKITLPHAAFAYSAAGSRVWPTANRVVRPSAAPGNSWSFKG